jgi:hypothetical protein
MRWKNWANTLFGGFAPFTTFEHRLAQSRVY